MQWAGHVAHMQRTAYKVLMEKSEETSKKVLMWTGGY
jgi:hypothetical protein